MPKHSLGLIGLQMLWFTATKRPLSQSCGGYSSAIEQPHENQASIAVRRRVLRWQPYIV